MGKITRISFALGLALHSGIGTACSMQRVEIHFSMDQLQRSLTAEQERLKKTEGDYLRDFFKDFNTRPKTGLISWGPLPTESKIGLYRVADLQFVSEALTNASNTVVLIEASTSFSFRGSESEHLKSFLDNIRNQGGLIFHRGFSEEFIKSLNSHGTFRGSLANLREALRESLGKLRADRVYKGAQIHDFYVSGTPLPAIELTQVFYLSLTGSLEDASGTYAGSIQLRRLDEAGAIRFNPPRMPDILNWQSYSKEVKEELFQAWGGRELVDGHEKNDRWSSLMVTTELGAYKELRERPAIHNVPFYKIRDLENVSLGENSNSVALFVDASLYRGREPLSREELKSLERILSGVRDNGGLVVAYGGQRQMNALSSTTTSLLSLQMLNWDTGFVDHDCGYQAPVNSQVEKYVRDHLKDRFFLRGGVKLPNKTSPVNQILLVYPSLGTHFFGCYRGFISLRKPTEDLVKQYPVPFKWDDVIDFLNDAGWGTGRGFKIKALSDLMIFKDLSIMCVGSAWVFSQNIFVGVLGAGLAKHDDQLYRTLRQQSNMPITLYGPDVEKPEFLEKIKKEIGSIQDIDLNLAFAVPCHTLPDERARLIKEKVDRTSYLWFNVTESPLTTSLKYLFLVENDGGGLVLYIHKMDRPNQGAFAAPIFLSAPEPAALPQGPVQVDIPAGTFLDSAKTAQKPVDEEPEFDDGQIQYAAPIMTRVGKINPHNNLPTDDSLSKEEAVRMIANELRISLKRAARLYEGIENGDLL